MASKKSKNLVTRNNISAKEIKARGANQAQRKKQGISRHREQQAFDDGMNDETRGPNEGPKPNRRSSRLTGTHGDVRAVDVPPTKRRVSNTATEIAAKSVARQKPARSRSLPGHDNGGLPVNEPRNPAGRGGSTCSCKDVVHSIPAEADRDHVPSDTEASAKIRELENELQAEKGGCS